MLVDRGALMTISPPVPMAIYPNPFAAGVDEIEMPEGLTIEAMLLRAHDDGRIETAALGLLRVSIGPHLIPRENWRLVRPRSGAQLVVSVQPANGGSGRALLKFAVAVAIFAVLAPVIGPGLAAAIAPIASNLIVNTLVPIRQPKPQERLDRYTLDGANNQARPHSPVPIILGRRRIYPSRAANYYTVMVGQDVYLRCLFQPSVGWVDRADVKIGETLASAYAGITYNWHTRADDATSLTWFASTPAEDAITLALKAANGWQTRSVPIACNRISLDLAFLSGLYSVDGSGKFKTATCAIDVRYGPRGGDPSTATPAPIGSSGRVTFTRNDVNSYRQTFEWTVTTGEYDVHVRRFTADTADTKISDKPTWVNLRGFNPAPALSQAATTPWVEVEIKASDQLNGALDTFNFVATTMVKEATATGPGPTWAPSRNPADLFLAATYPPYSDLDLDADERVFADLASWRTLCAAQGWNCDIAEDGETSVGDLLQRVAATGRARPTVDFGALTVMVDWVKPVPRQMFAARTVQTFKGDLVYPETVDALRLRFANQDKAYADDTVVVYSPGQDITTATRYDSIEIRDKTAIAEVEREGQRILAERLLRPESFTFSQDVEQVAVREGERAWLQHPVGLIGQVAGRVMELLSRPAGGGGTQYGVRLDELVTMIAGGNYGIAWRPGVAAVVSAQVDTVAGDSDRVWFTVTPAALPAIGDLVAFGERLLEVLDVVVDRVTPKPGLRAEISCVAYAPELQDLDSITIHTMRSPPSIPPGAIAQLTMRRDDAARDAALTAALQQSAINTRNVFRGAWGGSIAYDIGDIVIYGGSAFLCSTAHTSATGTPPPNANFSLYVEAGSDGAPGAPGADAKWFRVLGDNKNATDAGFVGAGVYNNAGVLVPGAGRGHTLFAVYAPTGASVWWQNFDTYSGTAGLISVLTNGYFGPDHIVMLYTDDACSVDAPLRAIINSMGGSLDSTWAPSRTSHVFIGMPGIGKGRGYEKISTSAGADGVVSVQAYWSATGIVLQGAPGPDGADGSDGANGLGIAATVPIMAVARTAGGLPKAGQLPKSTQMIVYDGFTDVTAIASYTRTTNDCSVSNNGGGSFTLTAVGAVGAYFDVNAAYGGRSITMRIPTANPLDGPAASRASANITSMNSGTGWAVIGSCDIVAAAGTTITVYASANYAPANGGSGTRYVRQAAAINYYNYTDVGPETSVAGETVGTSAVYISGDGISEGGSVSASGSFVNSTGAPKQFRILFYIRKYDGTTIVETGFGFGGAIEVNVS